MASPDLTSTGQYIAFHACDAPDTVAVIEGEKRITYRYMAADLARFVVAASRLGVGPGMLVGLQIRTARYFHLLLILACEIVGATTMSVSAEEIEGGGHLIQYCDLIIADLILSGPPKLVALSADDLARVTTSPLPDEHMNMLRRHIPPAQIARIIKSSGTTGRPKAMPITHATQQLRRAMTMRNLIPDILPRPRFLCLYDIEIGVIYVRILAVLGCGGRVAFGAGDDLAELISSGAYNFAAFAQGDIEHALPNIRPCPRGATQGPSPQIDVFGAAASAHLRRQLRERLNAVVRNKYSSNETHAVAVIGDDEVGTLFPGVEVKIVDETGREMPWGRHGIIRVKSDTMVRGYFNDKVMTDAHFVDGWFHTSDLGIMPAPGRLIVLGRADDVLNIGGIKIAPGPIEARLRVLDGVHDAVVMSAPRLDGPPALLAAIEIGDAPLTEELAHRVGTVLAGCFDRFEIMPVRCFPRTATGKVKRPDVEADLRHRPAHQRIIVA